MRCGLGGFPPVVVRPFDRLGVESNHFIEAASFAGYAVWVCLVTPYLRCLLLTDCSSILFIKTIISFKPF